jgi:hypothetical protein
MHQILRIAKENISTFRSLEEAERWIEKMTLARPKRETT